MLRAVLLGTVVFLVGKYAVRPAWTTGSSMEPTVADRHLCFVYLPAYRHHPPQRGDIVAIEIAGPSVMYLKRILALPGETVAFKQGQLLVNGTPQDEPYVGASGGWNMPLTVLGPNEYFVAGDNRGMDRRNHLHGVVHRDRIRGRLLR